MFSCWNCCGNEGEENAQFIFKGFDPNHERAIENRVSRSNRQQLRNIIQNTANFTMIRASNYEQCLKECQTSKTNFVDKAFPPDSESLNFTFGNRKIIWKRIVDVIDDPVMIQGTIQPADVQQGNVGDCYFLASISSIAENPQRINRIFDNKMEISKQGIYKLIICEQGQPKELIIDDYIPVFAGSNRPVFCKPNNKQIWVMLLEKAWAKLSGSYGETSAGYPHEVLNTFLVAPCFYEDIHLQVINEGAQKFQLWKKLMKADSLNLPMCVGSRPNHICKGIKPAHTYSLLACYEVRNHKESTNVTKILKLRNPWGDTEYTGRHSECDNEFWSRVDPIQRMGIFKKRNEDDGIFTMELDEFIRNFESLDVSHDRKDFNYVLEKAPTRSFQQIFFEITVLDDGQCYITVEKGFKRSIHLKDLKEKTNEYGYIRLILFKKQNQTYNYIASKLQPNFPDVSLYQKDLKAGKYIIATEGSFPTSQNNQGNFTVSVYSKFKGEIDRLKKPDPQLFHKIFMTHAIYQNDDKKALGNEGDWTASKFMYEEGGLGYIAAHLDKNSGLKLKIFCDTRKVNESGYKIIERNDISSHLGGQIEIDLNAENNNCILVFAVDFTKKKEELKFPPKGVKVTRII